MLFNPNANFVSINGKIGIGALLYEIAEEMNSQYYINEYGQASMSTYLTDALRCFRARGYYKSGVFTTTNYEFSNNLKIITNIRPNR